MVRRLRALAIVWFVAACPDKSAPRVAAPKEPRNGQPCTVPTKPALPDAADPQTCAQLGGAWVDQWEPGSTGPRRALADGGTVVFETGWQVLGRGNRRFRGCSRLPAPDKGEPCEFDFHCLGGCVAGTCSAVVEPRSGLGCGPRCVDGVIDTRCFE